MREKDLFSKRFSRDYAVAHSQDRRIDAGHRDHPSGVDVNLTDGCTGNVERVISVRQEMDLLVGRSSEVLPRPEFPDKRPCNQNVHGGQYFLRERQLLNPFPCQTRKEYERKKGHFSDTADEV